MTRAGTPPTIFQSPTSLVTTAPAATMAPRPIRLAPSLLVTDEEIDEGLAILAAAMEAAGGQR